MQGSGLALVLLLRVPATSAVSTLLHDAATTMNLASEAILSTHALPGSTAAAAATGSLHDINSRVVSPSPIENAGALNARLAADVARLAGVDAGSVRVAETWAGSVWVRLELPEAAVQRVRKAGLTGVSAAISHKAYELETESDGEP